MNDANPPRAAPTPTSLLGTDSELLRLHALDHAGAQPTQQRPISAESSIGELLDRKLAARCVWWPEMLTWEPGNRGQAKSARNDRVLHLDGQLHLDGGPPLLIGIELKKAPEKASAISHYAAQAGCYARGQIAPTAAGNLPPAWCGQPLHAVLLLFAIDEIASRFALRHLDAAERLFGAQYIGFFDDRLLRRGVLELRLSAERLWTEAFGFHRGMARHRRRSGSGYANGAPEWLEAEPAAEDAP